MCRYSKLCGELENVVVQMGGVEGVRNSEEVAITLAPSKGLFMHAEPRQI